MQRIMHAFDKYVLILLIPVKMNSPLQNIKIWNEMK